MKALRLWAVIAVLLLADLVAVNVLPRRVTLKAPGELADVVPELQRFVERTRGKRFPKQVDIVQTDDFGSVRTVFGQSASEAAVNFAAVLLALGLVDAPYDPNAVNRALSGETLGVYDAERHRLLVRPGPVTPRLRLTLVHELTHALDGSHYRLFNRSRRVLPDESQTSFRALVEGDANWVEHQYRETLTAEEKAELDASRRPAPTTVPEVLLRLASYPYAAGEQFVRSLVEREGVAAVDRAFEDPPVSSEQVLHVDRYLAGDDPRPVVKPLPRGPVIQRGVFGELLLRLLIARVAGNEVAQSAGTGWAGGRYVAWREGVRLCVRVTLLMDTTADTEEVVVALRQWAADKPASEVVPGRPVTLANCVDR